ncbi:hypothetical protein QUF79_22305 [Fictibacillus enclensis]|uniref:hypothetical protein n=1 Tax=Fictibacillus enclensis TaxID=1017270 RepID=UPI0025A0D575|nr:hypothetical protein [Fictibacillus enclensis]MDM5200758.1 hypothetical protein [Fictibacillus enclensis]
MINNDVVRQNAPHPLLLESRQVASNQVLLTYDQAADLASATEISNYWIRSNMGINGVASLGMSEALTSTNAITPDNGMITPYDPTKRVYLMTFRTNVIRGVLYIVLPCFVNLEGRTGFRGENWGPFSKNGFIGL